MEDIFKDIEQNGLRSTVFDAYLARLRTAIDEAYNAGENDKDYVAMVKIGEAKVYFDAIEALWKEYGNKK